MTLSVKPTDFTEASLSVPLLFKNYRDWTIHSSSTSGPRTLPSSRIMIESDRELSAMVQELWDNDINRLQPGKDYRISLQVHHTHTYYMQLQWEAISLIYTSQSLTSSVHGTLEIYHGTCWFSIMAFLVPFMACTFFSNSHFSLCSCLHNSYCYYSPFWLPQGICNWKHTRRASVKQHS